MKKKELPRNQINFHTSLPEYDNSRMNMQFQKNLPHCTTTVSRHTQQLSPAVQFVIINNFLIYMYSNSRDQSMLIHDMSYSINYSINYQFLLNYIDKLKVD